MLANPLADDSPYHKPRQGWQKYWFKYRYSMIIYFSLAVFLLTVYHLLSDGDFSFLMTLGSVFTTFSFSLLLIKVFTTRSVAGISLKSLQCYALVFMMRLASILMYEGYLPYDRSGDWFYQVCETLAFLQVAVLIVAATLLYPRTYTAENDSFGTYGRLLPSSFGILFLVVPAMLLAIIFHPSLNGNWLTDTAWTWALYLEAVSLLPQLVMFARSREKSLEVFTSNFVFGLAVARVMHFVFWLSSFHELNERYAKHWGARYPGQLVVFSQLVNILLVGDYAYQYIVSARKGRATTVLMV